jgi:ketosteroid isomerase-like protein
MSSQAEAVRQLWDAWSRGAPAEMAPVLDPEVEWESVILGRSYRGREEVATWLEALRREWKSLTVTFDRAEDAGPDLAIAYGRATGFDYGGDQAFDTPLTWVAEFRDGLIVRGRVFTDEQEARDYVAQRAR